MRESPEPDVARVAKLQDERNAAVSEAIAERADRARQQDSQARSVAVLLALGGTPTGIRRKDCAALIVVSGVDIWVSRSGALEPDVDGLLDA